MRRFECERCDATVAFDAFTCDNCDADLGYLPADRAVRTLEPGPGTALFTVPGSCPDPRSGRLHRVHR